MLLNAKNGTITIGDAKMDYISFGKGSNVLIMIPGLGDGLTTVKGKALPFALAYKGRFFAFFNHSRLFQFFCSHLKKSPWVFAEN